MSEEIEIACEIERATDSAYLVNDGATTEWIPKSQVSNVERNRAGDIIKITIPLWLAEQKGFV